MTPAEVVLDKWGGNAAELADDLGYSRSIFFTWQNRGGHIPTKAQQRILEVAAKKGINITARNLIVGLG